MAFFAFVLPLEELAKRGAAMAVLGLFFRGEFGEGPAGFREIEQRIVTEPVATAEFAQNEPLGAAVKGCEGVSTARRCDDADKAADAVFVGDVVQLPQQAGIVGLVSRNAALMSRTLALGGRSRVVVSSVAC